MHQLTDAPIYCSEQNGRDNNEDSLLICPLSLPDHSPAMLCLLADGMGGHAHGEYLSREALLRLSSLMLERLCLRPALNATRTPPPLPHDMPTQIWQMLQLTQNHLARLMHTNHWDEGGTTLAGCLVTIYGAWAFNVGDSPIFHCRPDQGSLTLCSSDHSVAGVLLQTGQISPEMARYHEGRHRLMYYLGNKPLPDSPAVQTLALQAGDILMLCSDGVSNTLQQQELRDWLCQADDLSNCARQLLQTGRERDETDNQSLILWRIPETYRPRPLPQPAPAPALTEALPVAAPDTASAAAGDVAAADSAPDPIPEAETATLAASPAMAPPDSPLEYYEPLLEQVFVWVSQTPEADVYLLTIPVTWALWQRVCPEDGSALTAATVSDCPVTGKTPAQIAEWIAALNQQTQQDCVYRLPSEAEWLQPWHEDADAAAAIGPDTAWCESPDAGPQPVGQKQAVAGRFYDLAGNVWEWVSTEPDSAEYYLKGGAAHLPRTACQPMARREAIDADDLNRVGFRLSAVLQRGTATC